MTPRPHITAVPMPVQAQQIAEARARFYRATPLTERLQAPDVGTALKDTIFADDEPFDAEAFVEEVCCDVR